MAHVSVPHGLTSVFQVSETLILNFSRVIVSLQTILYNLDLNRSTFSYSDQKIDTFYHFFLLHVEFF